MPYSPLSCLLVMGTVTQTNNSFNPAICFFVLLLTQALDTLQLIEKFTFSLEFYIPGLLKARDECIFYLCSFTSN